MDAKSSPLKLFGSGLALAVLLGSGTVPAFSLTEAEKAEAVRHASQNWMKLSKESEDLFKKGDFSAAAEKIDTLLKERQGLGLDLNRDKIELARIYFQMPDKQSQAKAIMTGIIQEQEKLYGPSPPEAIFALNSYAEMLESKGLKAEAAPYRAKAKIAESAWKKMPVEAVQKAEKEAGTNAGKASRLKALGLGFVRRDLDAQAVYCFKRAIELNPKDAEVLSERGECLARLGKEDEAKKDYDQALALNPKLSSALFRRGLWFQSKEKLSLAMADFNAAIAAKPQDCDLLGYRAKLFERLGKRSAALADYAKVMKLDPDKVWPLIQRGGLYMEMGDYAKAEADFSSLISRFPKSEDYLELRAKSFEKSGRFAEAMKDIDLAIKLNPYNRGLLHVRKALSERIKDHSPSAHL